MITFFKDEYGNNSYFARIKVKNIVVFLAKQGEERVIGREEEWKSSDEQKPIDKVEPKFKVGDWLTSNYSFFPNPIKIVDASDTSYITENIEGFRIALTIGYIDKNYHLWTVQDAKEGDVLAAHECLVLFKEIDGLNIRCYGAYYMGLNPRFGVDTLQNKDAFYPVTKEQRDLLFKKMKEAGYEWDAKKKELKKIE